MHLQNPTRLTIALCASLLAGACQSQETKEKEAQAQRQARAATAQVQAQVQELLAKTRSQMKPIAGGSYWMGDFGVIMGSDGEGKFEIHPPNGPELPKDRGLPFTYGTDNKPPRWVTLTDYAIGSHKVTYGDFDVYLAANALPPHPPAVLDEQSDEEGYKRIWRRARTADDIPAGVTWNQAKGYCQWLAQRSGLAYDLPTEAQWEYAASNRQNHSRRPYPTADGKKYDGITHPGYIQEKEMIGVLGALYAVARFAPSPDGLYDLLWNGMDWVNDWYAPGYHTGPALNPQGPASGTEKVLRGVTMGEDIGYYKYLDRYHISPENWVDSSGDRRAFNKQSFRCALNPGPQVVTETNAQPALKPKP